MKIPQIVAHRGESHEYPENTLTALEAALQAGANYVEFDVQLSVDCVPIVIHDKDLQRTADHVGCVFEMTAQELGEISAGYSRRFGEKFKNQRISSLSQIVDMLESWPQAGAFVELKSDSIDQFGIDVMLESVLQELQPVIDRCILISYHDEILRQARLKDSVYIGWVFDDWTAEAQHIANQLMPDFLISDAEHAPRLSEGLWQGHWKWVLFEVNDPEQAIAWAQRGVDYIETNTVETYAKHQAFKANMLE